MNKNLLFAVDTNTEEVIVSESPKGSNKINFIERVGRNDNEILYNAVVTLTGITKSPAFDTAIFKAMDKVCQMVYNKHKETL
jgi:outer membrane lipoprotein-sorting protein